MFTAIASLTNLFEFLSGNFLFFALHFDNKSVFPKPLSAKEERACFEAMAAGDKAAKDKLIEHNLRLVAHIIKKYYSAASDQEDLISIGTIGLIKAVSTFDHKKGCRFATYGSRCVENEILMHFRSQKKSANDIHFDEPVDADKDGNQLCLIDIIADDVNVADRIELVMRSEQLYKFIGQVLDERERQIITLRYGLHGGAPLPQREVAKMLGISRSYVSRIEKKALELLRKSFNE
ncbi:RNA polymerase sporulation sigma factor SigK [Ruminococcus sp.]|uniref:RNA polymerase sporulation sigma factor SigK n=1 Tax=Ruminococcus sp. TaxID=41978 RepID=UPI0025EB87AA|nr:RNA polymerase sporulation sigma factor SigK [Ruminococcus sp.]